MNNVGHLRELTEDSESLFSPEEASIKSSSGDVSASFYTVDAGNVCTLIEIDMPLANMSVGGLKMYLRKLRYPANIRITIRDPTDLDPTIPTLASNISKKNTYYIWLPGSNMEEAPLEY
ncbi:hypothetical protein GGF41_007630 [Coemansia sp. RSA 2531]|nr:hypothetical protein GGF41_007630 [Coemansia sp. RSA 2531]